MTNIQLITYGGFLVLAMNRNGLLAVGWLLAMFSGVVPDNDAPLAFMVLLGVTIFIRMVRR